MKGEVEHMKQKKSISEEQNKSNRQSLCRKPTSS